VTFLIFANIFSLFAFIQQLLVGINKLTQRHLFAATILLVAGNKI
jgi:hypothetical protein